MSVSLTKISTYDRRGKFDSGRDEVLYVMSLEGWAMESDGTSEAPTGWFAMMENLPRDLHEISGAFEDIIESAIWAHGELVGSLAGWFLLYEDERGAFDVVEYSNLSDLRHAFRDLQHRYDEWLNEAEYVD